MSIYFRNTPVSAPFMFESLGNHWNQDNISRPDGYPYYHYLQTEKGTGRIEVRGCKRGDSHRTIGSPLLSPGIHLMDYHVCHIYRDSRRQYPFYDRQSGSDPHPERAGLKYP